MMTDIVFLYTTWPDALTARAAARRLIEQGVAACANIGAPMRAIYAWQGKIEESDEIVMIVKVGRAQAAAARDALIAAHPYETPCVCAIPIEAAFSAPAYLAWLAAVSDGQASDPST